MVFLTLDDAAILLLQLEVTDTDDLSTLRDALTDIAFENRVPLSAQPLVARAARVLGTIVSGTAPDAQAALRDVNQAIEDAMRSCDAPGTVAAPVAVAVAAPLPVATPSASQDPSVDRLPADADRDLLPDFITEGGECVVQSETALLQLESNPADEDAVNTVFRAFHTVKGTSAFLGLTKLAAFAHEAESLLSRVRDKEIQYTSACAELSLQSVDMLRALLETVEQALNGDGVLHVPHGYDHLLSALAQYDPTATQAVVARATVASESRASDARATRSESVTADASIRVRTDRLDRLIDMVSELVIAQSMIAGDEELSEGAHHSLTRKVTHAGKIVRELQSLSMSMRMVPLRSTFQKLTRVVRDTSVKAGKTVHFVTEGDDVEIDRTLANLLSDPLVHMVRNAVDHGVESPTDRTRAGKASSGTVRLSAYHASGNVVVELSDDGRGMVRETLVAKAIEKGLIEHDKGMSDSDVFALIFAPGFSTAASITDISGRGVGMDVVRQNLDAMRGRIDIQSTPSRGTTFSIRLPLTLAVTDGMIVRVGAERFVVPLTHIHMSFRPEPSMLSTVAGNGEAVVLRGEVMPIIRLHRLFDVPDAAEHAEQGLLMIVGDGARRSALLVDELLGQQQVVGKPLGAALGKVPGISGGAILGDGRVGLILDVNETVALAQSAPIEASIGDRDRRQSVAA